MSYYGTSEISLIVDKQYKTRTVPRTVRGWKVLHCWRPRL